MSTTNKNYVAYEPEMIPACSHCWYRGEPQEANLENSNGVIVSVLRWCPECGKGWSPAMCPVGSVAICPVTESVVGV